MASTVFLEAALPPDLCLGCSTPRAASGWCSPLCKCRQNQICCCWQLEVPRRPPPHSSPRLCVFPGWLRIVACHQLRTDTQFSVYQMWALTPIVGQAPGETQIPADSRLKVQLSIGVRKAAGPLLWLPMWPRLGSRKWNQNAACFLTGSRSAPQPGPGASR